VRGALLISAVTAAGILFTPPAHADSVGTAQFTVNGQKLAGSVILCDSPGAYLTGANSRGTSFDLGEPGPGGWRPYNGDVMFADNNANPPQVKAIQVLGTGGRSDGWELDSDHPGTVEVKKSGKTTQITGTIAAVDVSHGYRTKSTGPFELDLTCTP
jgi:hypothetical protein